MVERRDQLGLSLETPDALGVGQHGLGQHLDCHVAPEPRESRAR